jgi:thioredoxin
MKHLNTEEFREKVFDFKQDENWNFKGEKPCILDLSAQWCVPCKNLEPVLESLENEDYNIYKINIDEEYELAAFFEIKSVPTLVFCSMDEEPVKISGTLPKNKIETIVKEVFKTQIV